MLSVFVCGKICKYAGMLSDTVEYIVETTIIFDGVFYANFNKSTGDCSKS